MAEATYSLAILRHASEKPVEALVQDLLEVMGEAGDPYLEYKLSESLLFEQSSHPILEDLTLIEADRLQQSFLQHKVETTSILVIKVDPEEADIQPYTCPDCKSQQPGQIDGTDICKKCGIADIYQEQVATAQEDTSLAPGDKKSRKMTVALAGIAAMLAVSTGGYFIYNEPGNPFSQESAVTKPDAVKVNNPAIGAQGKSLSQGQAATKTAAVATELEKTTIPAQAENLSASELEELEKILQSTRNLAVGHTGSEQYAQSLPKLKRLLELDKPELGIVFAENISDPYAAALLMLNIAHSEQQKKRSTHHDSLLLTLKSVAIKTHSEPLTPLLTSILAQAYMMAGDNDSAAILLNKALQEAEESANSPAQKIEWLVSMLAAHQHFNQAYTAKRLTGELEAIAGNIPTDDPAGQLLICKLYTHLAAVSLQRGNTTAAGNWLKKIPDKQPRQYLLASLGKLKTSKKSKL